MSWQLGVDLGTTYTAAAIYRDGKATITPLGHNSTAIPSVVFIKEDGEVLTGDAAQRRANGEPERLARGFKRRLGDDIPLILGGAPFHAQNLIGELLKNVLDEIQTREGGPPSSVAVSHPANWGGFKKDLLRDAIRLANLDSNNVLLLTEPEAAAISYACNQKMALNDKIAVYDLGGGTFDAAVLERTTNGFQLLGKPEGIEHLGGVDFDAAVFAHVSASIEDQLVALDDDDPAAIAAVARLKQDCIEAKETLSSDTDATVPVMLPNHQTSVRITRKEFENHCKPAIQSSIEALRRAITSAGLTPDDLSKILLVGGSSRIPLVSQMVQSELGRPLAVDTHPKHAVALGAAYKAGEAKLLQTTSDTDSNPKTSNRNANKNDQPKPRNPSALPEAKPASPQQFATSATRPNPRQGSQPGSPTAKPPFKEPTSSTPKTPQTPRLPTVPLRPSVRYVATDKPKPKTRGLKTAVVAIVAIAAIAGINAALNTNPGAAPAPAAPTTDESNQSTGDSDPAALEPAETGVEDEEITTTTIRNNTNNAPKQSNPTATTANSSRSTVPIVSDEILVPDVSGMSEAGARASLIAAGFSANNIVVETVDSPASQEGNVVAQSLGGNSRADPADAITIQVGGGPGSTTTTVPEPTTTVDEEP